MDCCEVLGQLGFKLKSISIFYTMPEEIKPDDNSFVLMPGEMRLRGRDGTSWQIMSPLKRLLAGLTPEQEVLYLRELHYYHGGGTDVFKNALLERGISPAEIQGIDERANAAARVKLSPAVDRIGEPETSSGHRIEILNLEAMLHWLKPREQKAVLEDMIARYMNSQPELLPEFLAALERVRTDHPELFIY